MLLRCESLEPPMSHLGQNRTLSLEAARPLSPAADMTPQWLLAAMCQEATYAPEQTAPLFDHLVGAQQERLRDRQAERLGGRKIDDKLESGRLLNRDIAGLRTAQILSTNSAVRRN